MNANVSGLGETEEVRSESSVAPQDAVEPMKTVESQPDDLDGASDASTPTATMEQDAVQTEAEEVTSERLDDGAAPDLKKFKRGDVIEGTITSTSPTAVYVDVGGKTDGIIPGRELERMNRETLELLKPGEVISVYVVNPNDHKGETILSVNRALEELDWRKAEEFRESQQVYESHVAGYNKGGLIVRFGRLRGFVPQSQLGADRKRLISGETPEDRWGSMVNLPIAVKVMEVDRARNRLILSERAAARESRETRKESLIVQLEKGEVRTGRVVSLVDFGAFVDIGGAEGLIHLTELSWKHVTHPREILRVGQEVTVEVISIDSNAKRIGLSLKRQEADPWDMVASNYDVGQLVQGRVTKLTKFGAFTQLVDVPEIEGLVHISELSDQRVNHPREVVKEGEVLTLRVVKMDIENRRLGLSLKRVNSAEYLDMDWTPPSE
ncbi:MAG: S1 RNA-binding domain-containing protein [Chloroflexi bacterium]|nr:S1 RNA-binding domain-containing protein [Chloroflexota bacterium]